MGGGGVVRGGVGARSRRCVCGGRGRALPQLALRWVERQSRARAPRVRAPAVLGAAARGAAVTRRQHSASGTGSGRQAHARCVGNARSAPIARRPRCLSQRRQRDNAAEIPPGRACAQADTGGGGVEQLAGRGASWQCEQFQPPSTQICANFLTPPRANRTNPAAASRVRGGRRAQVRRLRTRFVGLCASRPLHTYAQGAAGAPLAAPLAAGGRLTDIDGPVACGGAHRRQVPGVGAHLLVCSPDAARGK